MPIISAVGLFYYDKFEETPSEKVVNMSKLTTPYFCLSANQILGWLYEICVTYLTSMFIVHFNFSGQYNE